VAVFGGQEVVRVPCCSQEILRDSALIIDRPHLVARRRRRPSVPFPILLPVEVVAPTDLRALDASVTDSPGSSKVPTMRVEELERELNFIKSYD